MSFPSILDQYLETEVVELSSDEDDTQLIRLPSPRGESTALAEKLCGYCVVSVTDFEKKAIFALIKRLYARPQMIEELCTALDSQGEVETACVAFPRTRDGRIQIGKAKYIPSFIYARIFRFKNLTPSELLPNSKCLHSDGNQGMFCVNPFHYHISRSEVPRRKVFFPVPNNEHEPNSETFPSDGTDGTENTQETIETPFLSPFDLESVEPQEYRTCGFPVLSADVSHYYDPANFLGTSFLNPNFDVTSGVGFVDPSPMSDVDGSRMSFSSGS
ncbi:hypothetical protein QR680_001238 [Steinernema hermaphroditum]|uniref:MH1 domain-containing protein n=1 Tax=Steinernema hermaphroditum TaxID=289476 RepID=A0AA39GZ08_9BILA|nr:hypothetical protein QR680_001238 [Steinernema hermaphroditum]